MFLVEYDEASAYAEENSLLFMETSAKTAVSVVCGSQSQKTMWTIKFIRSSVHCNTFHFAAKRERHIPGDCQEAAEGRRGGSEGRWNQVN